MEQIGSSLSVAVDRLDKALAAVETRLRALQSGDTFTLPPGLDEEMGRLQGELEEARAREQQLAQAAHGAFEALGHAAANIRILLREEAA